MTTDAIKTISTTLPTGEVLAQLAEEAAELAQAALKLRRAMTGINLHFSTWKDDYSKMRASLAQADTETEAKLRAAIKKQMEGWLNAQM